MKVRRPATFAVSAVVVLLVANSRADNLRVPSSVFTMDKFEEAKEEALAGGEPLVFVYTNPGST